MRIDLKSPMLIILLAFASFTSFGCSGATGIDPNTGLNRDTSVADGARELARCSLEFFEFDSAKDECWRGALQERCGGVEATQESGDCRTALANDWRAQYRNGLVNAAFDPDLTNFLFNELRDS